MSVNFSSFEIARRALAANQLGIAVTGQNIANVNTPGYSRQRLELAESRPGRIGRFSLGTGVDIAGVSAYRDGFVESRLQAEVGISGRLTARRDGLAPVEAALQGSSAGGIQNAMAAFFGAFRDLEANPNSAPLRGVVVQKANNLTSSFQSTRSRLEDIQRATDGQVRAGLDEVNVLSKKIAELNANIKTAEATGANASPLIDQRTELINQIAEKAGARAVTNDDGTVNITIGEGRALVSGATAFELEAVSTPPNGFAEVQLDGQPAIFDEGTIKGLQEALAESAVQIADLDALAANIAQRVNALHTSGTDLDGNAGQELFDTSVPVTAANLRLNPIVAANPRLVVASPVAQPGESGTVAGRIADLLTDTGSSAGSRTGSFSSIFGGMVSDAGEAVKSADDALMTQAAIVAQVTAQRNAASGVSLDEEAINLMQYQRAYEAAARFMRVADEMTQTILSLAQ